MKETKGFDWPAEGQMVVEVPISWSAEGQMVHDIAISRASESAEPDNGIRVHLAEHLRK